eukprot:gene13076-20169_t
MSIADELLVLDCGERADRKLGFEILSLDEGRVFNGRQAIIIAACAKIPGITEPVDVVIKRVAKAHIEAKGRTGDARTAFIESAETELTFYDSVHMLDASVQPLWPKKYLSYKNDTADTPEYVLVLEDLVPKGYSQTPNLDERCMKDGLEALATLHAAGWVGRDAVKARASSLLKVPIRGTFWALCKRAEPERDQAAVNEHWQSVCASFLPDPAIDTTLGERLRRSAPDIDRIVENASVTTVHGDAKGPNMFFKNTPPQLQLSDRVRLIDSQWMGYGNPLSDVANFLSAGLAVELLPQFDSFFQFYETALLTRLPAPFQAEYRTVVKPTWDTAWLDYCRCAMLGLWRGMCPAKIARNKGVVGLSMISQSLPHVRFLTQRVNMKLKERG